MRRLKLKLSKTALAGLIIAASASAQTPAEVSLTRFDCGKTTTLADVSRFSDVRLPGEVQLAVSFALVVRVTVGPVSPEAKRLDLEAPAGESLLEVTVIARPNGLELQGTNLRRIPVPLTSDSDPVRFELIGRQEGRAGEAACFPERLHRRKE